MKQNALITVTRKIGKKINDNSPAILTGLAITGVVSTSVMAVRATPTAIDILERAEEEHERELKPLEVVKYGYKPYLPAIGVGTATIACMVGATAVSHRRNAALAGIYSITESTLKEYQEQVKETVGEKKEAEVREKVNEKRLKKNPVQENKIIIAGDGDTLFYDTMSGRYFTSNIEDVRKVVNDLNRDMIYDMWCSLNTFYSGIGLEPTESGNMLGWNVDNFIDIDFDSKVAENGKPCIVLDFLTPPVPNFHI